MKNSRIDLPLGSNRNCRKGFNQYKDYSEGQKRAFIHAPERYLVSNACKNNMQVPYLMAGGTDSSKFYSVCNNIYRFSAVILTDEDKEFSTFGNEKSLLKISEIC